MFSDICQLLSKVQDLDEQLFLMSNKDLDIAIRGSLDMDRLSPKWKKINYFRQCAAVGNQILTNVAFYKNRENPNLRETLARDFFNWRLKNSHNLPLIYSNDFTGWQREVVNWYNLRVSQGVCEPYTKQLFIWGDSMDKTRFFKHLFGNY